MKNILKYLGMFISAVLPIAVVLLFFDNDFDGFHLYYLLWCGFYGSILVCLLFESKLYKAVTVILNLAIIIMFCTFGAMMGGAYGLGIVLLNVLIPFELLLHGLFV